MGAARSVRWARRCALPLALAVAAGSCAEKRPNEISPGEPPADAGDGSAPADASTDAAPETGPPGRACATPVFEPGDTIAVPGATNIVDVKLAWSGGEAAVAFVHEENRPLSARLTLQRLDRAGHSLGTSLALPLTEGAAAGTFALASDASSFLACWDEVNYAAPRSFRCASLPVGGAAVTVGRESSDAALSEPTLAFDGTTRLLAGFPASGWSRQLRLEVVGPSGEYVATMPASWGYTQVSKSPRIAVRSVGHFVVAGVYPQPENGPRLAWVDVPSPPEGSHYDGYTYSLHDLAANEQVAVAMADNEARTLGASSSTPIAGLGGFGRVVRAVDSFATVWSHGEGVRYRALSAAGVAEGTPVDVPGVAPASRVYALAAVNDGFLLATTNGGTVVLTHLRCP